MHVCFLLYEAPQPACVGAGYELASRVEARWYDLTVAMYALLREALRDPVNAYFVLLSEACLPLYPAAAVYLQIVHEPRSRIAGAALATWILCFAAQKGCPCHIPTELPLKAAFLKASAAILGRGTQNV